MRRQFGTSGCAGRPRIPAAASWARRAGMRHGGFSESAERDSRGRSGDTRVVGGLTRVVRGLALGVRLTPRLAGFFATFQISHQALGDLKRSFRKSARRFGSLFGEMAAFDAV